MFYTGGGVRGYSATGEGGSGVVTEIPPWHFVVFGVVVAADAP